MVSNPSPSAIRALLTLCATLLAVVVVLATLLATRGGPVAADRLSSRDREALVEEILADSPGIHRWAFFEPHIGYTLRPGRRIDAWSDRFTSNEIGFRAPALAKPPGTFRVVFVGDSWTFGMGLPYAESFPAVVERLAVERGAPPKVQAWSLALPGYNLLNSLAALDFFWTQLAPDVVVVVPSSNDQQSSGRVLPNGSLWTGATVTDEFGAPHVTTHRLGLARSYEIDRRWRVSADRLRTSIQQPSAAEVPFLVLFVARWRPPAAHAFMTEVAAERPYAVVRNELTLGKWMTTTDEHGNAAANELYARVAYQLLALELGWPRLDDDAVAEAGTLFPAIPEHAVWQAALSELRRSATERIAEQYVPSAATLEATAGGVEVDSGEIGRAATLLVRRAASSSQLIVELGLLPNESLYPLSITVTLPSRAGGNSVQTTIPTAQPSNVELSLAIPADIPVGDLIDVVITTNRATAAPPAFQRAQAAIIRTIRQQ